MSKNPIVPNAHGLIRPQERQRLVIAAQKITGDAQEAEDLVQDTLLKWWTLPEKPVENPGGYLMQMLLHKALNRKRDAARQARILQSLVPAQEVDPMPAYERIQALDLALATLLERLNPLERAVVVLREAFSFSYKEIANLLDIREDRCRQALSRARKRLTLASKTREQAIDEAKKAELVARFAAAANEGALGQLVELLAQDAQTTLAPAAAHLAGPVAVAQQFTAMHRLGLQFSSVHIGSHACLQVWRQGLAVMRFEITLEGALIRRLDATVPQLGRRQPAMDLLIKKGLLVESSPVS